MLPNPKKNKKTFISDEVTETKEDKIAEEKKRLQKKRRTIIVCLILTVGLSFSFWAFRSLKKIFSNPPKINLHFDLKLPQISSPNLSSNKSSTSDLDKFIKNINSDLSIIVSSGGKNIYQYQPDFLNSITDSASVINSLSQQKSSPKSLIDNLNLPEGLLFQEQLISTPTLIYQNLISLPNNKLLIIIRSKYNQNISNLNNSLPSLIEKIYWYSINQIK